VPFEAHRSYPLRTELKSVILRPMVMRVAVALLALSLSACTTQTPRSSLHPTPTGAVFSTSPAVSPQPASGTRRVFVKFESGCGDLAAVERTVPRNREPMATTLILLFAGPTEAERARGVASMFSRRTAGLLRSVHAGTGVGVQVDLAPSVAKMLPLGAVPPCDRSSFQEQVATTLQQFPGVHVVTYTIGGDRQAFQAQAGQAASLAAYPSVRLHDREAVQISVRGFDPGSKVFLSECGPGQKPREGIGCAQQLAAEPFAITDDSGAGNATFTVRSTVASRACGSTCRVFAVEDGLVANAPLTFAG
jgi:hypothetical protein